MCLFFTQLTALCAFGFVSTCTSRRTRTISLTSHAQNTGWFKTLHTWGKWFLLYKTCSIWASRASAQENDLYSLYRQRYFSILLKRKMQLTPLYGDFWITLNKAIMLNARYSRIFALQVQNHRAYTATRKVTATQEADVHNKPHLPHN